MSEFKCEVVRVGIEPHPNADAIEVARVGDYQSIVRKGQVNDGDLAVYIPEQSVVPEWLLRHMGLWDEIKSKGGLSGSSGNRVKAIKLRGVLSQGLILPARFEPRHDGMHQFVVSRHSNDGGIEDYISVAVGEDAAEFLGITKYEPPLPSHMRGKIVGVDYEATHKYDFDNLKKTPDLFEDGEQVVITEKIHGTLMQVCVVPSKHANEKYYGGRVTISSKGLGAKGFILDHNDETNLYAQAAKKHGLLDKALNDLGNIADEHGRPVFICGEVFGKTLSGAGIQDLTYADEELDFAAFDICVGNRGSEKYLEWNSFAETCFFLNIKHVPLLYSGPYSKDIVLKHTDGNTTLAHKKQIREGVVVKSATETRNPKYGRKIAKSISEQYLLRKGNATEFN